MNWQTAESRPIGRLMPTRPDPHAGDATVVLAISPNCSNNGPANFLAAESRVGLSQVYASTSIVEDGGVGALCPAVGFVNAAAGIAIGRSCRGSYTIPAAT